MDLCQYKNSLGEPGKGFHERRVFGLAANDLFGTIIIGIIIAFILDIDPFITTLALLLLGEILHVMFCVDTAFIKKLNI
jgi:hypothetical protein